MSKRGIDLFEKVDSGVRETCFFLFKKNFKILKENKKRG
jgi:hypothetical protein